MTGRRRGRQSRAGARFRDVSSSCRRGLSSGSGRLLTAHGLLYESDDHHQNSPADPAGSDLTDNRADIEAACSSRGDPFSATAHERTDDLCSYPRQSGRRSSCQLSRGYIVSLRRQQRYHRRRQRSVNNQTDDSAPHLGLPPLARLLRHTAVRAVEKRLTELPVE